MISMGQWTDILGRDVPLIELQQWKTYRQRNIDSGWPARGQRFFIREMSVTHSSYEFPTTEMEIIFSDTPSTPLRISVGHGATVNEVLFQIWLLTEHVRIRDDMSMNAYRWMNHVVERLRRIGVYASFTAPRVYASFTAPRVYASFTAPRMSDTLSFGRTWMEGL